MKYTAIIMVPTMVEFENPGSDVHIGNQAHALCGSHQTIQFNEFEFAPKLMGVFPSSRNSEPLVFDPPPMVA